MINNSNQRNVTSANCRETWQIIGVLAGAAAAVLGFLYWAASLLMHTGQ